VHRFQEKKKTALAAEQYKDCKICITDPQNQDYILLGGHSAHKFLSSE
jgi:hypothetical protein